VPGCLQCTLSFADGSWGEGEAMTNMNEVWDEMAARCGFPTVVLDSCYKEGIQSVVDQVIGPERDDFIEECVELVKGARDAAARSDKSKWRCILRVITSLRRLRHMPPRHRPRRPPPSPNDIQLRNDDGSIPDPWAIFFDRDDRSRSRDRSRSPARARHSRDDRSRSRDRSPAPVRARPSRTGTSLQQ